MSLQRNLERFSSQLGGGNPETEPRSIDYRARLEQLGFDPETLDDGIIRRFQEHFELYVTPEAGLARLEERLLGLEQQLDGKIGDERVETLVSYLDNNERSHQAVTYTPRSTEDITAAVSSAAEDAQSAAGFVNWVEGLSDSGFGGFFKKAIKGFFSFLAIFGITNPFNIADDVAEGVAEAAGASQEALGQAAEAITSESFIPERIRRHPALQPKIRAILEEVLTPEDIARIQDASEGDIIDLQDVKEISAGKWELIVSRIQSDPEIMTLLGEISKEILADSIAEQYPYINTRPESRRKLMETINAYVGENQLRSLSEAFLRGEKISFGELFTTPLLAGIDSFGFMFSLVGNGVISASDIILNISDDVVQISCAAIGALPFVSMPVNAYTEKLSKMDKTQKHMMLAIMYRKSGPFVRLVGSIGAGLTSAVLDTITPGSMGLNRWEMVFSNTDKKIDAWRRIEAALGQGSGISDDMANAIRGVRKNYELTKILDGATEVTNDIIRQINTLDSSLLGGKTSFNNIRELLDIVGPKMHVGTERVFTLGNSARAVLPGLTQAENSFLRSIDNIQSYQRARVTRRPIAQMWQRGSVLLEELRVARQGERVLLNVSSLSEGATKMRALKRLAIDMPDLFRHTLGAFPEIAFIGLDVATRDENTTALESVFESLSYMTGILGPVKMIWSSGVELIDGQIEWYNIAGAGAGTILIGMDVVAVGKIISQRPGLGRGVLRIGNEIVLRPITNLGRSSIAIGRFGGDLGRVILGRGSIELGEIIARAGARIRNIKPRGWAAVAALVGGAMYVGHEYLFSPDIAEEYQAMIDAGMVSETGEILDDAAMRAAIAELSDSEQALLAEIILEQANDGILSPEGNFSVEAEDNTVIVTAEKSEIGAWVLSDETAAYFESMGLETEFRAFV